jgi:hypothetical protein
LTMDLVLGGSLALATRSFQASRSGSRIFDAENAEDKLLQRIKRLRLEHVDSIPMTGHTRTSSLNNLLWLISWCAFFCEQFNSRQQNCPVATHYVASIVLDAEEIAFASRHRTST